MAIQTKTMKVKSDTALAETTTTIRDTVTFDTSKLPNGITYKGLKAVLSFADPIQWNRASAYDSLTVVWDDATHASYASKRPVPQNIELTNEFYWFRTADLDAQVEMYRQEVQEFNGRIIANAQAIAGEKARAEAEEQALDKKTKQHIVTIGDSFGDAIDQGDNLWPVLVSKQLGMVLHNYCEGGAGYVKKGNFGRYGNFIDELDRANEDSSFDNSLVKRVIVYGGYNDVASNQSTDTFNTNSNILFANALMYFPNAQITVFGINTPYQDVEFTKYDEYRKILETNAEINGICFTNSTFWNACEHSLYKEDNLHPNATGSKIIAKNMLSGINGDFTLKNLGFNSTWVKGRLVDKVKVTFKKTYSPSSWLMNLRFTIKEVGTHESNVSIVATNYMRNINQGVVSLYKESIDHDGNFTLIRVGCAFIHGLAIHAKFDQTYTTTDNYVTGDMLISTDIKEIELNA